MNLKAQYAREMEVCLCKYVNEMTARNIVHLLFANLPERLAGHDIAKGIRPLLFSLAIRDALAVRRATTPQPDASAAIVEFLGGMTLKEAASLLGIPLGSFKTRAFRLARRLSYAA